MLKRIKKITGLGIFSNFTAEASLKDFARFNLFYGWNGCGKTTLSKLFGMLDTKTIEQSFPECKFEIELTTGDIVKSNALDSYQTKVFVFNQSFVEENIDWKKQGAKSIVVISGENIEARNEFFELRDKKIPLKKKFNEAVNKTLANSEKERDSFQTELGRTIKQKFQLIDTADSRYLNYDKSKLKSFIDHHLEEIESGSGILSDEALLDLKKKVQPIQKPELQLNLTSLPSEQLVEAEVRITKLLNTKIVNESIDRLRLNEDINGWVQQGLEIHKRHESSLCEFCGQDLSTERMDQLNRHFNKIYIELTQKLYDAKTWVENIHIISIVPDPASLYDEFAEQYKKTITTLKETEQRISDLIVSWSESITKKIANAFDTNIALQAGLPQLICELEELHTAVKRLIDSHNKKTQSFSTALAKHRQMLELHFVSEGLRDKKYFELLDRIQVEQKKVSASQSDLKQLTDRKSVLDGILANAALGAEEFNTRLHRFLGRAEITLKYDSQQKGYKFTRDGSDRPASNLSEGEKTAIAFVYFTIKMEENGNVARDSVIVVDDPISSFDSNHLFHSFAFLKKWCEPAKQLFVLTHNFQYFKLVRDWLEKKNYKEEIKSQFYAIEAAKGNPRQALIVNAHPSLLKYGSEYHFITKKLFEFLNDENLNIESSYQVANYSRKLLEAFFAFKLPKGRANFYALFEAGCKEAKVESEIREKVYRFINKYSHNELIEFHDSAVDNLIGEGENITNLVFEIIAASDPIHYKELFELCSN